MNLRKFEDLLPMRWRHALVWRRARLDHQKRTTGVTDGHKIYEEDHALAQVGWMLEDESAHRLTCKLRREAERLHVAFPPLPISDPKDDEIWRLSTPLNLPVLTPAGAKLVRTEIREERKARRDAFVTRAPALTGLVSAMTGLLAVVVALAALRCA